MDVQSAVNQIISNIPAHWSFNRVTKKAVKEIEALGLTAFVPAWMLASGAKSDAYVNAILAAATDAGGKKVSESGWSLAGDAAPTVRVTAPSALYSALNSAPEPTSEPTPEPEPTLAESAEITDKHYNGSQPVIVTTDTRLNDLRAHMTGRSPYEADAPAGLAVLDVAARQRGARLFEAGWRIYKREVADGAPPAKPVWATTHEATRFVAMSGALALSCYALCAPGMTAAEEDWQLWSKPVEFVQAV